MALERVTLSGRHVRLEPLGHQHVDGLVLAANEDRRHYDYTWVPTTVDDARAYVENLEREFARATALAFAVVVDGRVVGSTRFLDIEFFPFAHAAPGERASELDDPRAVEIGGTWYAASAQRTVCNTESKLLLLTHAFETWNVGRVSLKTDARNARSRTAIARIGATFEGVRRFHMVAPDGTIRDSAYFSIIASEWPTVKAALEVRVAG